MDINDFMNVSGQRLKNLEILRLYLKCSHVKETMDKNVTLVIRFIKVSDLGGGTRKTGWRQCALLSEKSTMYILTSFLNNPLLWLCTPQQQMFQLSLHHPTHHNMESTHPHTEGQFWNTIKTKVCIVPWFSRNKCTNLVTGSCWSHPWFPIADWLTHDWMQVWAPDSCRLGVYISREEKCLHV